jgi:glutathione S-transferase
VIKIVEGNLATNRWMLGADFSLVDCAYSSVLNVIEKAQCFADFPKVKAYLDAIRARLAWEETPKLPML